MHRKVAAALLAALALGVAGCGGSETTLSRADLVRRVEVACREAIRTAQRPRRESRASGSQGTVDFVNAVLGAERVLAARIKTYSGSGEAKADFAEFKQAMQQRIVVFERIGAAGAAGVQRAIQAEHAPLEGLTRRLQAAAGRLGLQGCV